MLTLSRKVGQKIQIADNITITIKKISRKGVSIGVEAPREVPVIRGELRRLPLDEVESSDSDKEQIDGSDSDN